MELAGGFVLGVSLGLPLGLFVYSHIYQHFLKAQDEKAAKRVALALQEQSRKWMDRNNIAKKIKEQYGELPEGFSQVMEEELGAVFKPGGRN